MNSSAQAISETQNQVDFSQEQMQAILQKQRDSFMKDGFPSLEIRIDRLNRLEKLLRENQQELVEAMAQDFGHRSHHQSLIADFYASFETIKHQKKHIKKWMKKEKRKSPAPLGLIGARSEVHYQPKGVIGNITTWNFPVFVAIGPTAAIIGAGNRCMVKLTEVTPHTSNLMQTLFAKYFDETEVAGITGGPETGADFSSLDLDHILFTGATSIGKYVLQGAANTLTPVTLELGGKSPVVIGKQQDLKETALRIFTGKALNVGQVCISPDYAFVHESQLNDFIQAAEDHIKQMFPTMLNNPDYTSVVNERHYQRLQSYIQDAQDKGGDVRQVNPANEDFSSQNGTHKIPMTIVVNPSDDMKVMQEEIFGPLISIKTYKDIKEVVQYINANPRPLALYYFGHDNQERDYVLQETISGGVAVNDVVAHAGVEDIPFGGIGPSGMGNYHGYEGFKTFSHQKAVFKQSKLFVMKYTGMMPPYGEKTDKTLEFMLKE